MVDLPSDGAVPAARIAEMLAPTLGWEKGTEVVAAAVAKLGVPPAGMTADQAHAVLGELSRTPGMVGIAARFARSRFDTGTAVPTSSSLPTAGLRGLEASRSASPRQPPPSKPATETAVTADEVAALLASAMGADKAQEIVRQAVHRLGFSAERLDRTQAMALLDHLAGEPGVLGLCARFGKARLILRFAA